MSKITQSTKKNFYVYVIGKQEPLKITATGWQIENGQIKFEGADEELLQWTFFAHGVAAIKVESEAQTKAKNTLISFS